MPQGVNVEAPPVGVRSLDPCHVRWPESRGLSSSPPSSKRIRSLLAGGPGEPQQCLLQVGRHGRPKAEQGVRIGADRLVAGQMAVRGGCGTHSSDYNLITDKYL